jgi:DNA-binding IclR family transcriptional regulator
MEHSAATVEKAIDLLFHLHDHGQPQGVSALSRALDAPKSSVHRLLLALSRRGIVERDDHGRYRPGNGLVALGAGVLDREPVVAAARAVLPAVVERIGETLFVVADQGGTLRVLDKCEGGGLLRASPRIGSRIPVHCTAVGRLHMGHLPEIYPPADIAAKHELSLREVEQKIERALERGWDSNIDEWQAGLGVIAAPVLVRGRLRAAVALGAATPRLQALGGEALAPRVAEAANLIAARLAGGGR